MDILSLEPRHAHLMFCLCNDGKRAACEDNSLSTTYLDGTLRASEVAGAEVQIILLPEPDWCAGKRFTKNYFRGRHCGREETSVDVRLELMTGGFFSYHRHDQEHDADEFCGFYSCDRRIEATGEWFFLEHEPVEGGAVIKLSGR
eukprot:CAMPEP_0197695622 /NCGR_PEP_ID=MMETSP1338-20131121/115453_1 /TAXON_ID=43686 ORGANISM="Pelagodinium beii, Strain RCC1491" /NCGR_SAMPLE_ID=MMETSP1338 /ASSEMBLY_ACC=CAM_ASM_000754 /LENGTH=144 /DNA_ID=CAMNT_0043278629 /DNA_START=82 /DNA_END=512 /DNA_ORIENTATION=+